MKKHSWVLLPVLALIPILFTIIAPAASAEATFTLREGWNLVNMQVLEGIEHSAGGLEKFIENGGALFMLNPVDKKYYGGRISFDEVQRSVEEIKHTLPGGDESLIVHGFWLYNPREYKTSPLGWWESNTSLSVLLSYYRPIKGWNLFGPLSPMIGESLSSMKGDCQIISAYRYEKGNFRKQGMEEEMTEGVMGYGLAVKVENDCRFGLKSMTPSQIPSLPE